MSLDVYLEYPEEKRCVYDANITHNLNKMAMAAGIYTHLWHPKDVGVTKAAQLIEPLRSGLARMVEAPTHFESFNAENGWGMYEHFVPFIAHYLEACIAHPDATVRTWV